MKRQISFKTLGRNWRKNPETKKWNHVSFFLSPPHLQKKSYIHQNIHPFRSVHISQFTAYKPVQIAMDYNHLLQHYKNQETFSSSYGNVCIKEDNILQVLY